MQVQWVLKKPDGVFAAWCYTMPEVNTAVDELIKRFYENPYRDPRRRMVDEKYGSIDFPFEAAEGAGGTGPFRVELSGKEEKSQRRKNQIRGKWNFLEKEEDRVRVGGKRRSHVAEAEWVKKKKEIVDRSMVNR